MFNVIRLFLVRQIRDLIWWFRISKKEIPERFWMFLAWLLPRKLVMWATIRLIANATQDEYGSTWVGGSCIL